MKYLLYLGILSYLFLSTTVAAKIGILQVGTFSSAILVLVFFLKVIRDVDRQLIRNFKEEFCIILLALVIIIVKILSGQLTQIPSVLFFFVVPMILSIVLGTERKSIINTVKYLVIFFFIIECFLAIYERIYIVSVFPEDIEIMETYLEDWSFRSSGLLGNPLTNALCVSTIMGFILISSIRLPFKMALLILGFISLLCFNARASTIVWVFLTVIYIINIIRSKKTKNGVKFFLLFFLFSAAFLIYLSIINYGLGGRLINEDINDGSAKARVDVIDAFLYIDNYEFWYGNAEKYTYIMNKLGVAGVENSFIVFIIFYGVILFVFLFIAYYFWLKKFLNRNTLFDKFIILSSFLAVGSSNNGLINTAAWGFLILGFYCFVDIEKKPQTNTFVNKFQRLHQSL